MSWRPAQSLVVLRDQLNADYPGWLFLGFLGDQAHAAVPSDHNPNAAGVVCALDIGPGGGLDIHGLADRLLAVRHPDLKYLISNRRIAGDWTGWRWTTYYGSDPHDTHIHVSVGRGDDGQSTPPYDDTNKWNVKGEEVMATIQRGDVTAIWATFMPKPPKEEDYAWAVGKTWEEYTKAIMGDPRMHPQKEDVDRIWTALVDKTPGAEDYDYAKRASWSAYVNALLAFPPTISVKELHDAQTGSGDPDEHALAEAVRKVVNK